VLQPLDGLRLRGHPAALALRLRSGLDLRHLSSFLKKKPSSRADEGHDAGRRPALILASAGSASRRIQALSGTGFFGAEVVRSVPASWSPGRRGRWPPRARAV